MLRALLLELSLRVFLPEATKNTTLGHRYIMNCGVGKSPNINKQDCCPSRNNVETLKIPYVFFAPCMQDVAQILDFPFRTETPRVYSLFFGDVFPGNREGRKRDILRRRVFVEGSPARPEGALFCPRAVRGLERTAKTTLFAYPRYVSFLSLLSVCRRHKIEQEKEEAGWRRRLSCMLSCCSLRVAAIALL